MNGQIDSHPTPKPPDTLSRLTRRLAAASARWPKSVLALWLLMVVAFTVVGGNLGTKMAGEEDFGTGESKEVRQLVSAAGLNDPMVENILISSGSSEVTSAVAKRLVAGTRDLDTTGPVRGPANNPDLSTAGGRIALVQVTLRGDPDDAATLVEPVLAEIDAAGKAESSARLQVVGPGSINAAFEEIVNEDLRKAELISLPITLLILFLAFGALVAASVPLFLGVTSVIAAIGGMGLISQLEPMDESAISLVVLMGLAVGVDYSLFYIRREREERRAGRKQDAALNAAAASVGRAIVISGLTVIVALCGLILTGLGFFVSMGLATMLVVTIAVIGSLTALPALLAILGDRVERGRLPGASRLRMRRERRRAAAARRGQPFGIWERLAAVVTRRPKTSLVVALCLLGTIAVPALEMRTGNPGSASLPEDTPIVMAERAIDEAFPGAPASLDLLVVGGDLGSAAAADGLDELGEQALAVSGGAGAVETEVSGDGSTALLRVPMAGGHGQSTEGVIDEIRSDVAPRAETLVPGAEKALVGGDAADSADFKDRLNSTLPIIIAVVLGLALALLLVSFRSLPLALSVIGLNLVSVAAAYGVLTLVFQNSWAEGVLGFSSFGGVADWVPTFVFVILFALSMDYTILVLERMREARRSGLSPRAAAREGVSRTAGAVTSAAIVMVAIFMIFPTLPMIEMKMLGLTLAVGVLLDATIVRGLALPATVALLGERGLKGETPVPAWDDLRVARPEVIVSDGGR